MEKERLIWIDLLNIVSCAGVLLLHCTNEEVQCTSLGCLRLIGL